MAKSAEADPRAIVRSLYRGIDGFQIPASDEKIVRAARSSPTYGEIMPSASLQLVHALQLGPDDVFFDLGAGVGKLMLFAALATTVRRVVGVELSANRYARGHAAIARAQTLALVDHGRLELRQADILATPLDGASVVYTCATAFPYRFTAKIVARVARLGRPITFVSTQVLDPQPRVKLREVLRLDMSWRRRAKVYVYAINADATSPLG